MIITTTVSKIRVDGGEFLNAWEAEKKNIQLPVKSMYALLKLKKSFEDELLKMNDLLKLIAEKYGAEITEQGQFTFPKEHIEEANKELIEFSNTEIDFEYIPIRVNDDSFIPPTIFESIFDFIDIEE